MFQAYGTISDGNIYHIGKKMAITWLPSQPLPQTFSIYRSKIQAILSMKSPNIPKKQHIPIKTDALSHNKEWKIKIWGKIYIVTSYEMMCSEIYRKLVIFTGTHFVTQNGQFLVNGNRYDKNKNTHV